MKKNQIMNINSIEEDIRECVYEIGKLPEKTSKEAKKLRRKLSFYRKARLVSSEIRREGLIKDMDKVDNNLSTVENLIESISIDDKLRKEKIKGVKTRLGYAKLIRQKRILSYLLKSKSV